MILAILEILALLTISCLIGVFFTHRYWKAKYNEVQNRTGQLQMEIKTLREDLKTTRARANQGEIDLVLTRTQLTIAEDRAAELASQKHEAPKENHAEAKKFKEEIALLKEETDEKERELEEVSKELEVRKISYYRHIDGKRYKAATLNMADEAIEGQGDGRISMADAEMIFDTISSGHGYTQVEKHTVRYLRDNYNWTEEADLLFRTKVRSWAAMDHELA